MAFTTSKELFEPMVMFFRLTNSLVTFQTMINELLRNLINIGKVVAFIDDIIIGIEDEEGHNELVAEVVKKLEENDLYIKPEKCKWKVRGVEFLEVVIILDPLEWDKDQTLVLEKTQENSIESSLQSSLSYIPIHMVYASYCAFYSKVPCVRYKVNMWYIYCMISLLLESFTSFHVSCDLLLLLSPYHVTE